MHIKISHSLFLKGAIIINRKHTEDIFELGEKTAKNITLIKEVSFNKTKNKAREQLMFVRSLYVQTMRQYQKFMELPRQYEWLCDNFYILEQSLKSAIKLMAKQKRQRGTSTNYKNVPFIYVLSHSFCKSMKNSFTIEDTVEYIKGIQQVHSIRTSEMGTFPIFLKIALLDNLYKVAKSMSKELYNNITNKGKGFDKTLSISLTQSINCIIHTLKRLEQLDYEKWYCESSNLEKLMNEDISGVYPKMSEKSKQNYRERVAYLSKKRGLEVEEIVQWAQMLCASAKNDRERHIGYWLFLDTYSEKQWLRSLYKWCIFVLPLLSSVLISIFSIWWIGIILFLPIFEVVKGTTEYLINRFTKPTHIPRLELKEGIPDNAKTLVVISALLTNVNRSQKFLRRLDIFYNANKDKNITFALLGDFADCETETDKSDEEIAKVLQEGISALDEKYGQQFAMFIRHRIYNKQENRYMCYERKRGAIEQLVQFINGKFDDYRYFSGDQSNIIKSKYIITIDADTDLLMDSAKGFVSAMLHPQNKPQIKDGRVVKGYALLTPCMEVNIESAGRTPFSRWISGFGGVDSYSNEVNDIYQDLFYESIFTGKGIFDVSIFNQLVVGKLPEDRVLSHDILEGGILRAGFLSDVKLTDGFPSNLGSYFDRTSRWFRGDVQNLLWIFPTHKVAGKKYNSPFNLLTKCKLLDNVRRPLTPVMTTLAIVLAFIFGYTTLLFAVSSLWLMAPIIIGIIEGIIGGSLAQNFKSYYSNAQGGLKRTIVSNILWFLWLPYSAYVSVDAQIRAYWRLLVSRKKLLKWVTAEQSETGNKNGLWAYTKRMWIQIAIGVITIIFTNNFNGIVIGVLWALSPILVYVTAKPNHPMTKISDKAIKTITEYCSDTWKYFAENMNEENFYLPPDNIQEKPIFKVAKRTSPTNIGLGLLSVVAARDFNFIETDEMLFRLEKSLTTVESLKKWKGHLLNWYNLEDLSPLIPQYVSTVDSGNFCVSLKTLEAALNEYINHSDIVNDLIKRVQALYNATEWEDLYDTSKDLFYIGYDIDEDKCEGSYDLFMSEARTLSYMAIAQKIVPKKHWSRLSRPIIQSGLKTGFASWTGTMFEYFMPHIFLPIYKSSAVYEALCFALDMQIKQVNDRGVPFGISESGYYDFDAYFNYQYQAFGVAKLGLKRGLEKQLVISPYSSFLAMLISPKLALENLKRIKDEGFYGKYGFYEAIDYTSSRVGNGSGLVRSYMSHHIGMSILSAVNACQNNIMQRRFFSFSEFEAVSELLKEPVPQGGIVLEKQALTRQNAKPDKTKFHSEGRRFENAGLADEHSHIISNGELSYCETVNGNGFLSCNKVELIPQTKDYYEHKNGIFTFVQSENNAFSLTPLQNKDNVQKYCTYDDFQIMNKAKVDGFSVGRRVSLLEDKNTCIINYLVANESTRPLEITISTFFEVSLNKYKDFNAHKAYAKLFVQSEVSEDGKFIYFKRRPRSDSHREHWMCVAFGCDEVKFDTRRNVILPTIDGVNGLIKDKKIVTAAPIENWTGACIDPALYASFPVKIKARTICTTDIVISYAEKKEEAFKNAKSALEKGYFKQAAVFEKGRLALKEALSFDMRDEEVQNLLLNAILFPKRDENVTDNVNNTQGIQSLWKYSISGDLPIIIYEYSGDVSENVNIDEKKILQRENEIKLSAYLKAHRMLRFSGVLCDFVFIIEESDAYNLPIYNALLSKIRLFTMPSFIGITGGVFILTRSQVDEDTLKLLYKIAVTVQNDRSRRLEKPVRKNKTLLFPLQSRQKSAFNYSVGETVCIEGKPPTVWNHILSNRAMGTVLSDKSLGFTFVYNARENKLTPWNNDMIYDNRGERLILCLNDRQYDLCALSYKTEYSPLDAKYFCRIDNLEIVVQCMIVEDFTIKLSTVSIVNNGNKEVNGDVTLLVRPVLGVDINGSNAITLFENNRVRCAKNQLNKDFGENVAFVYSGKNTSDKELEWAKDLWRDNVLYTTQSFNIKANENMKLNFALAQCNTDWHFKLLIKFLDSLFAGEKPISSGVKVLQTIKKVQIKTPNEALDAMFNVWLPHQTLIARIYARTGNYQNGGAFGFRDQLQDTLNAIYYDSNLLRRQIVYSAHHQYEEGDVQHWWHKLETRSMKPFTKEYDRGVRTRCSDDLLWLPYGLAQYCEFTGELEICNVVVPYIKSPILDIGEHERYETPYISDISETVYEHCKRAIEHGYNKGNKGLLKMGGGDWNDGMNLVGIKGQGESVWLSQFAVMVLERFAVIADKMNDSAYAVNCRARAEDLRKALEEHTFDGEWYKRAFYDDGTPLGTHTNEECKIDSLSQSFAQFAGLDKDRTKTALESAYNLLFDKENQVIQVFTKAFDKTEKNPGYIKGYIAGIRENGGQYSHAAVWLSKALIENGQVERGYELLCAINPYNAIQNGRNIERYVTEPYALCGDVYFNEKLKGRGGWSLYTGASGWFITTVIESIFGINVIDKEIYVKPSIPKEWNECEITVVIFGCSYNIKIVRNKGVEKIRAYQDGELKQSGVTDPFKKCEERSEILIEITE